MSRLKAPIVALTKQKRVQATIKDVLGDRCSVTLSSRGAVLHYLKYIGTKPSKGDTVYVDYSTGSPIVYTNSGNVSDQINEAIETLATSTSEAQIVPPPAPEIPSASQPDLIVSTGVLDYSPVTQLNFPTATVTDLGDGVIEVDTGGGGSGPEWFNVVDYGAVGDGTTDDTSAVNSAIADLNTAGKGVLYFPVGEYLCTSALTAITADCLIRGDGPGLYLSSSLKYTISRVICNSATAALFTINGDVVTFKDITIVNTAGSAPSAGAGITVTSSNVNQRVSYQGVQVHGFYINIDVQVGTAWSMIDCIVTAPVLYGLKIRNTQNQDSGDWAIANCWFSGFVHNSNAGIRIETSGGGKILNCKFNGASSSESFLHAIDLSSTHANTGNFQISNCSIENVRGHGIKMSGTPWHDILIYGCQFGLSWNTSNNTGNAINIDNHDYVIISNCTLRGGTTPAAIALANLAHARLIGNINIGFSSMYTDTSCTDVVEIGSSGAGVSSLKKFGETGLTGDVTLTGGTNVTLTQVANNIEISASGSVAAVELVMEDGVTFPPVPVTTEDGSDWIYSN